MSKVGTFLVKCWKEKIGGLSSRLGPGLLLHLCMQARSFVNVSVNNNNYKSLLSKFIASQAIFKHVHMRTCAIC